LAQSKWSAPSTASSVTVDPSSISRAIRARPIGVSTFALDVAPQRARAVDRVVSLGGDQLPGRGRELERYSAGGQAAAHVVDLEARDLSISSCSARPAASLAAA
jgi:hypothetical protein